MKIYIDGSGFNGKESRACITNEEGKILETIKTNEVKTNNDMEYLALFNTLMNHAHEGDEILTDSQLLVGQCTKGWKINAPNLKMIAENCKEMIKNQKIKLTWVPREQNKAGKILEYKDSGQNNAKNVISEELLEEIKCTRAVLERMLRVMDEGLFVDYQLEKWGKIIKDRDLEEIINVEESIKNPENKKKLKEGLQEKLRNTMYMPDGKTPRCALCGNAMERAVDRITGKLSNYEWKCKCNPNILLSIG